MNEQLKHYFGGDTIAADTYLDKYAIKDESSNIVEETPDKMHRRLAKEFARIEYYKEKEGHTDIGQQGWDSLSQFGRNLFKKRTQQSLQDIEDEFFFYFDKFRSIIPQGSIMSNLGNPYQIGSLSNCFGISSPYDSYGGILHTDQEIVQLQKRRGGVGLTLDTLRYENASVTNSARSSTGIVSFAERYSNTTREVAQKGRRGALMLLLSCKHPDIFKFVSMKNDRTKVTGANVSSMLTNKFMRAVEASDDTFICIFPANKEITNGIKLIAENISYNIIVKTDLGCDIMKIHARELFDLIVEMAWKNGEPGVAYIDTIQNYCPDGVYELYKPVVCNPCGEQWFSIDETCRLMAINLFSIVVKPFTSESHISIEKLYEISYMQQRLGDNLVDLECEYIDRIIDKIKNDPEPEDIKSIELNLWIRIKKKAQEGRRTGSGFTGLGDMLAAMGYQYQSKEALALVEQAMRIKMQAELDCTIDLAILRGTFNGWDKGLEFNWYPFPQGEMEGRNSFFQMLTKEFPKQAKRMFSYGRRNVSWSTVAPTGTVSLMTQTTSGLEPLFKAYYIRRKKINPNNKGVRIDFTDQNGDKWTEYPILHPKFKEWIKVYIVSNLDFKNSIFKRYKLQLTDMNKELLDELVEQIDRTKIEELFKLSPWYKNQAENIHWEARIKMNSVIQKYTSNAISCTINLPEDVSKEVVSQIYMEGWKVGLKGITVYREGSRSGVLVSESNVFGYTNSIKRPKELKADYRFVVAKNRKYAVITGLLNEKPYEIFAFENPSIEQHLTGKIIKIEKGVYRFEASEVNFHITNLQLSSDSSDEKLLTRFVSSMLRHGMNPKYIIEQIGKCEINVVSFGKAISKILRHYIPKDTKVKETCPSCNEDSMIFQEGCVRCSNCGYSKC